MPALNIVFAGTQNQKWFARQIARAEKILADALDKAETFPTNDRRVLAQAITHASIIDHELLQLQQGRYEDFSEGDEP